MVSKRLEFAPACMRQIPKFFRQKEIHLNLSK